MEKIALKEMRQLVADLMSSAGCSCCRDDGGWDRAEEKLARLLGVPMYKDKSGYNFNKFRTKDPK